MLFMSIYTTVDGMFVSKCVSTDAMAAINICYPVVNVMFAIGFGLASGGSIKIAYEIGKGNEEETNRQFSLLIMIAVSLSMLMSAILLAGFEPLLTLLGATEKLMGYCKIYAGIAIISYPIGVLKEVFAGVMRTKNMSEVSMLFCVLGGVSNIILDYLFIEVFGSGVMGAAVATSLGMMITLLGNMIYVFRKSGIHFCKISFGESRRVGKILKLSAPAGILELSYAIITWFFNQLALKYSGENGVAAFTVIGYLQYAMAAVFIGIGNGIAPFLSSCHGANNMEGKRKILKKSFYITLLAGCIITAAGYLFSGWLVSVFLDRNTEIYDTAKTGIEIIALSYFPMGVNIIISTMFNSSGRERESAALTFARTVFFLVIPAVLMSRFFKLKGIWMAYVLTEVITLIISVFIYGKNVRRGESYDT